MSVEQVMCLVVGQSFLNAWDLRTRFGEFVLKPVFVLAKVRVS